MTFPCNTKLFPLQPEIKYMSMETIYLGIVIFLFVLAIFDLVVGVSNDAVNFLQSAVGAKAASFKTILFIAGIGVFIGAALSNGMMDIARHGIYQPEHFYFAEIMCILLAVMLTDVVLLDVFNTMGMPTSTTVSMVFELLGGTFALALIKVYNSDTLGLGDLINTDKALSVIMAIFVSVAIAFFFGMLVQWLARIVEGSKERVQLYRGVVIKIAGHGDKKRFTVRKMSGTVGVERIFPIESPAIDSITVNKVGKVRRAKLYYLRALTGKKARIQEKRVNQ